MAINRGGNRSVVQRIVRPAFELADRQVVFGSERVHRRRVRANKVQVSRHVVQRVRTVSVPDEALVVSESGITKAEDVMVVRDHVDGR